MSGNLGNARFTEREVLTEKDSIIHFDCQSKIAAWVCLFGKLVVRDLDDDCELFTERVKNPHRVFVHPLGSHICVATTDGYLHYYATYDRRIRASCSLGTSTSKLAHMLSSKWTRRHSSSSATVVANAICWAGTRAAEAGSADEVLTLFVGAATGGTVYEVAITVSFNSAKMRAEPLLTIAEPLASPCGPIASIDTAVVGDRARLIAVTTPDRLFSAAGDKEESAAEILRRLRSGTIIWQIHPRVPLGADGGSTSAPSTRGMGGRLVLLRSDVGTEPQSYAWLSSAGLVHGLCSQAPTNDGDAALSVTTATADGGHKLMYNEQTIPLVFPQGSRVSTSRGEVDDKLPPGAPIDFSLTAFHLILFFPQHLVVLGHPAGLSWDASGKAEPTTAAEVEHRIVRCTRVGSVLGAVRDVHERRVLFYSATKVWALDVEGEHLGQLPRFLSRAQSPQLDPALRARYYRAAFRLAAAATPAPHPVVDPVALDEVLFSWASLYAHAGCVSAALDLLASKSSDIGNTFLRITEIDGWDTSGCEAAGVAFLEKKVQQLLLQSKEKGLKQQQRQRQRQRRYQQLWCALPLLVTEVLSRSVNGENEAIVRKVCDLCDAVRTSAPALLAHDAFRSTMVNLLHRHGALRCAAHWASACGDNTYLLQECLAGRRDDDAVDVLVAMQQQEQAKVIHENGSSGGGGGGGGTMASPWWYAAAPELVRRVPEKFTHALLSSDAVVEVERLFPAYLEGGGGGEAPPLSLSKRRELLGRLLQRAIRTRASSLTRAAHDLYVSILAEVGGDANTELLDYLVWDGNMGLYDARRALQECARHGRSDACVVLCRRLGAYDLALRRVLSGPAVPEAAVLERAQRGVALLREVREACDDVDEVKRLWMVLIGAVAAAGHAAVTLRVVDDSDGMVQLADVMDAVADGAAVSQYKDVIAREVRRQHDEIDRAQRHTERAYEALAAVKDGLHDLRLPQGRVTGRQRCPLCGHPVLRDGAPFLFFANCHHAVHEACALARWHAVGGVEALQVDHGASHHLTRGIRTTAELAQANCAVCGEAVILEMGVPITCDAHDDPAWDI